MNELTNNLDQKKIEQVMHKIIQDISGSSTAMLIILGDRLGLYRSMQKFNKFISYEELAEQTNTNKRVIKEWLANQVASGYIEYNPETKKYFLPPEHALAFANSESPLYIQGAFKGIKSYFKDEEEFIKMFRNERTLSWMEHNSCMAEGFAEFFKAGYIGNLLHLWIPAIDNGRMQKKLEEGITVADIGCGFGISTTIMAKAFPNSKFFGFDFDEKSIEKANQHAKKENLDNVNFKVSLSTDFPGSNYDFITFFDCLHDMGDPQKALSHTLESLNKENGTCMVVEPFSQNKLEDNINPISKTYYAASTLICVPNSLAFNGPALGAQAGEKKIKEVARESGFTSFKRVKETPINMVYELKP